MVKQRRAFQCIVAGLSMLGSVAAQAADCYTSSAGTSTASSTSCGLNSNTSAGSAYNTYCWYTSNTNSYQCCHARQNFSLYKSACTQQGGTAYPGAALAVTQMVQSQRLSSVTGSSTILTNCQNQSASSSSKGYWPSACTPAGLSYQIPGYGNYVFAEGTQDSATGKLMYYLAKGGWSPIVYIYGVVDHPVVVTKMLVSTPPTSNSSSSATLLKSFTWRDGLTTAQYDSGFNGGMGSGEVTQGATAWKNVYFQLINACTGSTCDPTYNKKYIFFTDPPAGDPEPVLGTLQYEQVPGVLRPGERFLTPEAARERVLEAMGNAPLADDQQLWEILERTSPGLARLVNGTNPDGSSNRYYLIPMINRKTETEVIIALSAEDGSWLQHVRLDTPMVFRPIDFAEATALVRPHLASDETANASTDLVFDPLDTPWNIRSWQNPHWRFEVKDRKGHVVADYRVTLDGHVRRVDLSVEKSLRR